MEFWVHRNGEYAGRFSQEAIREKVASGTFSRGDLVWDEGKAAWQPISEFLGQENPATTSGAAAKTETLAESATVAKSPGSMATQAGPPPLPLVTAIPTVGPPPLPVVVPTSVDRPAAPPAGRPPEGETISSPYVAIFWSFFLSPAFGGFIIWRNWLTMN